MEGAVISAESTVKMLGEKDRKAKRALINQKSQTAADMAQVIVLIS